jgi:hypothetical protein
MTNDQCIGTARSPGICHLIIGHLSFVILGRSDLRDPGDFGDFDKPKRQVIRASAEQTHLQSTLQDLP